MTENVTNPLHTLREDPLNAETTIRELIEPQQPNILLGQLMHFREYLVTKPLPTKGSEADLYLIQKEGQDFILKLYRNAMAPKQEVLNKIWALSRENPHQLVSILDVGFDAASARWYEIMEYLPLGSLRDIAFCWSDRRSFVLAMIHELTRSLHLLHQNEIVHCDLKPSNILIRSCNPLDLILTDFGIASQMASGVSLKMTSHKGTPMYWAPEAFSGLVAPASDWWALGIIALEYLVGKHPFDGFGQQQITYQLTVKNVEVPAGLGDMEMLLKGLLTKDAAKRWGYEQITRWLAEERDIPVYYENPETKEKKINAEEGEWLPFRFEGEELLSLEEIARAFAKNEERWQLGAQYLRYVRQWMESNGEFDKAIQLGEMLTGKTDTDLFHFIHSNVSLPFIYMGKVIDREMLLECVKKQGDATANPTERTIAKALDSETLLDLLDAYCRYNAKQDIPLRHLILLLRSAGSVGRHDYAEALLNTGDYLWPELPEGAVPLNPISVLKEIGDMPMRREAYEELRTRYALPKELTEQLKDSKSYKTAALTIKELEKQSLLLEKTAPLQPPVPLDSNGDCTLDLENYKDLAKRKNWGVDGTLQGTIARASIQLDAIAKKMGKESDAHWTISQLQEIRRQKVTQKSRDFVTQVTAIIEKNVPGGAETLSPSYLDYALLGVPASIILLFMFYPVSREMMIQFSLASAFIVTLVAAITFSFTTNIRNPEFRGIIRIVISAVIAAAITVFRYQYSNVDELKALSLYFGIKRGFYPSVMAFFQKHIYVVYLFRYGVGSMFLIWLCLRWRRYIRNKIRGKYTEMIKQLNALR